MQKYLNEKQFQFFIVIKGNEYNLAMPFKSYIEAREHQKINNLIFDCEKNIINSSDIKNYPNLKIDLDIIQLIKTSKIDSPSSSLN